MVNLYELIKQHRVYVKTLDELHAVQNAVMTHHPDASLEYIGDDDWDDYPYIVVDEDPFDGQLFVGQWAGSAPKPTDVTVPEFLAMIESDKDTDEDIDLSDCL